MHYAADEEHGRKSLRYVLLVRGGFSGWGAPLVELHPVIQSVFRTLSDQDGVQSTVSALALFLTPNRPYLPAQEAQLACDWRSFTEAVRGDTLFKCHDGWTPGSYDSLPPDLIPTGE